ncbi:MAG: hypothetical protein HRU09_18365 [Oligoflexales bacterium]|nr:hypothetical protein [Oligoflexales bacterium]
MISRMLYLFTAFICVYTHAFSSEKTSCVDTLLQDLKIHEKISLNQALVDELLDESFHLKDLGEAKEIIGKHFVPGVLENLRDRIKNAIVSRHPAINEVACKIGKQGVFRQQFNEAHPMVIRTLYNVLILEALVTEMVHSPELMKAIKNHYLNERHKILPADSSLFKTYRAAGGLFETAKLLTMDEVFDQYVYFLEKKSLNQKDL